MAINLTDEQIDEAAFQMAMADTREGLRADLATKSKPCPECDGTGRCPECDGEPDLEDEGCEACVGLGTCVVCDGQAVTSSDSVARAREAASGEGQVVS